MFQFYFLFSQVKILKFLHASNFQLHLPVTCWSSDGTWNVCENREDGDEGAIENEKENPFHLPKKGEDFWTQCVLPDELPTGLREECLQAAWNSARRVFELALEQNVDFVLLTGDMIEPNLTGARGIVFLSEQFHRLQERGIAVYWKLERSIEEWMLPGFHFPENVFIFPSSETHIKKFRLTDSAKNIFIASWSKGDADFSQYDFTQLPGGKLPTTQTIALCPDEETFRNTEGFGDSAMKGRNFPVDGVSYVALTTERERITRKVTQGGELPDAILHAPGRILYHTPDFLVAGTQPMTGGVTVVQLDLDGDVPVSLQFFPTETVAWTFFESRLPAEVMNWETLRNWMGETLKNEFLTKHTESVKAEKHAEGRKIGNNAEKEGTESVGNTENIVSACTRTLVFWKLTAEKGAQTEMLRELFQENLKQNTEKSAGENTGKSINIKRNMDGNAGKNVERKGNLAFLLEKLREMGERLPTKPWSVAVTTAQEGLIPASWRQAETMLGDFLRLVQFHLSETDADAQSPDFATHTLDLGTALSEIQRENGLATLAELTLAGQEVILEMASILGADALANVQEERKK
ncbi:MAG: hypothetical protein Q4C70_05370 [Planctomycetia bacterium]|nr:hypothetical protein [Planctomycetia bacterium]